MSNIIIPYEHQSAPELRYDPLLAREYAEREDKKKSRRDWDKFDWEMHQPGHDDPLIPMLRRPEHPEDGWTEENLELLEDNIAAASSQWWEGQEDWQGKENEEMRLVNILYPDAFIRKLRAAGVDARNEEHPNATLWLNDWTAHGMVGVNAWMLPTETDEEGYLEQLRTATGQKQKDLITENYYACLNRRRIIRTMTSLQSPGPEYSIMRFDAHNVPTKEKYRGWRTALAVLIGAGVITETQAERAFGPPTGPAGARYRATLKTFRQMKMGRVV
jgi:hypothetical protein